MATSLATACALAGLAAIAAIILPEYRRTAWWLGLAAVGQGAAVAMIDAGPHLHYQHYPAVQTLAAGHPWLVAMISVQAGFVVAASVRMALARRRVRESVFPFPAWRVVLALSLSVATAATVSADVTRYAAELPWAAFLQLLAAANMLLAARSWPSGGLGRIESGVARLLGGDDATRTSGDRAFALTAAVAATVLATALSVLAYQRYPHVPDEVADLYHAKYFADGQWVLPPPAVPAAFDLDLMEYEPTRWFSPVAPGWPAVLAVGVRAGAPWLVNPLLSGLNVLLVFSLVSALYGRRTARTTAALLAISPWFLFLGMSFMTHQLTLTAALVAALGIVRARESGTWWWGLIAGVGVGATSLVRPLDGLIVGTLIAAWSLGMGGARLRLAPLSGLALGTLLVGALVLPYNRMLTGSPLTFPINAYFDKHYAPNSNAYGFGPDRGLGWAIDPNPGHTVVDGLINANLNLFGINTDLFGWATGSLIFVAWLVCSGAWRRQDSVMMAVVLAYSVAHFPYYFSGGPDFGARYWFPTIVPLVVLSVRGMDALERRTGARVWVVVGAMSLMTLATYVPWRAADKYHHYRGMRADIRGLASEYRFGPDLVLVRGNRFPDYASAFALNPADLGSPVTIYAWDRNAETRAEVLRAYPGRRVWLVDGPTVTGGGFRVAGGPLEARALLAAPVQ